MAKHKKQRWLRRSAPFLAAGFVCGAVSTTFGVSLGTAEAEPVAVVQVEAHAERWAEVRAVVAARASRAQEREQAQLAKERRQARQERAERQAAAQEPAAEITPGPVSSFSVSGNRELGLEMMLARGWLEGQWPCLEQLWSHESSWNHLAQNPSSGAYGIPQALPGDKMASAGADWATNPATQIEWGLQYVGERYGSPCGAWEFWLANGWY